MTVRPVVKQTFRLAELADMVVSVTGKNVARVRQIFRAGTVVYNGYRYWWNGFASSEDEIAGLLTIFPDDDPLRLFNPAQVTAVSLEIGGGTQRSLVGIARPEASAKKLFHQRSPWGNSARRGKRFNSALREVFSRRPRRCLSRPPLFRNCCFADETNAGHFASRPAKKTGAPVTSRRHSFLHPSGKFCRSGSSSIEKESR